MRNPLAAFPLRQFSITTILSSIVTSLCIIYVLRFLKNFLGWSDGWSPLNNGIGISTVLILFGVCTGISCLLKLLLTWSLSFLCFAILITDFVSFSFINCLKSEIWSSWFVILKCIVYIASIASAKAFSNLLTLLFIVPCSGLFVVCESSFFVWFLASWLLALSWVGVGWSIVLRILSLISWSRSLLVARKLASVVNSPLLIVGQSSD